MSNRSRRSLVATAIALPASITDLSFVTDIGNLNADAFGKSNPPALFSKTKDSARALPLNILRLRKRASAARAICS